MPMTINIILIALFGIRDYVTHRVQLMSIEKSRLADYVGELSEDKEAELDQALRVALALTTEKSRKGARG